MDKDYQTDVTVGLGYELNKERPITTYSENLLNAKCAEMHAHPRAQIITCSRGVMEVVTPENIWIVNPMQSVWLPGNTAHQVYFPGNVKVDSIFIDPSKTDALPTATFAFDHSDFFKSLMNKIISFSNTEVHTLPQERVLAVFLDEVATITPTKTYLPTSSDKRVKTVTDALLRDISANYTIEYYAALACVSSRTLSRLFLKHLGISFGDWRIRLKLFEAIRQLSENKSVKEIAFDLGYENTSSFIHTFKKYLGTTPANYFQ
ncbi:AraC family transcriptional regulator [Chondrinema litorale]|uniref:AraC family transcriptional regulator n=1 Tax=Chondrinema litorale TaxID=2994555 RepID=UPI002542B460|nr:helix-turn-helix transcriptional regulator [Chondrinema litorale]UZR97054.1 helix-turn-helix transcriptional regulator [Chondrinema litorale]